MNDHHFIRITLFAATCLSWGLLQPTAVKASAQKIYGTSIHLTGTVNTHDLGGIVAKNGWHIKPKRLIRSAALAHLTKTDRWKLTKNVNVKVVCDFRSTGEIKVAKDAKLSGVAYRHDSVTIGKNFGVHTTRQYANQLANKQPNNMQLFYQKMVTSSHSIKAYRSFMNQLLKQKHGALLYHCTYGKDRTGIATMLILACLGVSKQTIMKNYLASNHDLKGTVHKEYQQLKRVTHNKRALANFKRSKSAKAAYLDAAYRAIDQRYGSMKHYQKAALRLSNSDVHKLRMMYLTK